MLWASPVDSIGTHQATPSWATLEAVIALATSRVLARLPPGSVQAAATPGLAELAGTVLAAPACLPEQLGALACGVLLAQPLAARLAAASRVTLATVVRVTKHLIWLISSPVVAGPVRLLAGAPRWQSHPPHRLRSVRWLEARR